MSDLDEIRKRLDSLRAFNQSTAKQNVTDGDLQERLRRLKGLSDGDPKEETANYFLPSKFRTDVEQSDDLLRQLCDEVQVDNKIANRNKTADEELFSKLSDLKRGSTNDPSSDDANSFNDNFVSKSFDRTNKDNNTVISDEELSRELGLLKNKMREFNYEFKDLSSAPSKHSSTKRSSGSQSNKQNPQSNMMHLNLDNRLESSSSEDEETKYVGIVKRFVDEVKLEQSTGHTDQADDDQADQQEADDRLDFCYICSEDATIECKDCEDRFCLNCFKEFHQDPEYRRHRYLRFNPKK